MRNKIEGSQEAARRAASLPIFLCHGMCMYFYKLPSVEENHKNSVMVKEIE